MLASASGPIDEPEGEYFLAKNNEYMKSSGQSPEDKFTFSKAFALKVSYDASIISKQVNFVKIEKFNAKNTKKYNIEP